MGVKGKSKYDGRFKSGDTFGEWTVIDGTIHLLREAHINCRCSCGFEGLITVYSIIKGASSRCDGCRHQASTELTGSKNPTWKGVGEIPGRKFRHIKDPETRALLSRLWDEGDKHCALTGVPLDIIYTASPDRIDSSKGYVEGNVQWVHKHVNIMKNAFEMGYFVETCRKIAARFPAENNR